jgi:hypothetical protein
MEAALILQNMGFQCFKFNGNQTENDRYRQKNNFYILQNVHFLHLHLKFAKSAIMNQEKFFVKNMNMGIKNRRILCCFQIRWCRLEQMPLK